MRVDGTRKKLIVRDDLRSVLKAKPGRPNTGTFENSTFFEESQRRIGMLLSIREKGSQFRNQFEWFMASAHREAGNFDANWRTLVLAQSSWINLSAVPLLWCACGGDGSMLTPYWV